MALLDRFRAQVPHKHPDPAVRLAFVEELPLDERDLIAAAARDDEDARVRRAAVGKLMDPAALSAIARDDREEAVRAHAIAMLRDLALEAFEGTGEAEALAAVDALNDAKALATVAKTSTRETIAARALARVADSRTLGSIARHATLEPIRRRAFETIEDRDEILAVALNTEFKDPAVAAVDRLTDRADLDQVAGRARNKNAGKRARTILREMDERAAAAAPPPIDPVEIAREEHVQVVQRLEALAFIDDPHAIEVALAEAAAAWASLASVDHVDPEIAERFAAASAAARARLTEMHAARAARERAAAEEAEQREARERAEREAADADAARETERRRVRLAELAHAAASAAADEDQAASRRRFAAVRREWKDLTATTAPDPEAAAQYAAADARIAAREAEAREADARARREALARMHQLLGRIEPLVAKPDLTLKAADRALRDVRTALGSIPPLPSKNDYEDVFGRLKAAQGALTPKVQELREIEDWQRWANVGIQEQLCEKMEALRAVEDPEEVARRIRELQQQWREAADVPRAQGEALWRRFKTAHDEIWPRCAAHFAAQAEGRAENLARKVALSERAEALAESTNWIQTAEEIKRLQAEWKTIGPVTRGQEKAIWERFRAACDRFFTRRQQDLATRKAVWSENFAKKEALCVRVEALAESTDWDAAAGEIKRLQAEWKTIGPVKKSRSEAIWQRFRGACDRFFERYAQRHDVGRAERVAAREAICVEVEALASPEDAEAPSPSDLLARIRGLRARWQQELASRGVDRDHAAALEARFAAAFDRLLARWPAAFAGSDLDPEANRKRMEALCRRIEDLAISLVGTPSAAAAAEDLSPTSRLAAMLKEALAANTIGGKVDEEVRWRAAADEVRQAQASWSRLGPVREEARHVLTDRFQRACRRIIEAAGKAAMAGRGGRSIR